MSEFHFDKDIYNLVKKNFLFEPKSAINFIISLPFMLPIKDKQIFDVNFCDSSKIIIFDTFHDSENYSLIPNKNKEATPSRMEYNRTRIECIIFSKEEIGKDDFEKASNLFGEVLETINTFINSLLMVIDDQRIYTISATDLYSVAFYQIIALPNFDIIDSFPLPIHSNFKCFMLPMDDEHFMVVSEVAKKLFYGENAFKSVRLLFSRTKYFITSGHYSEAVIFMQMTVESFIRTIYKLCLSNGGKSEDEIIQILEEIAFIQIIKEKMPKLLGGNWSLNDNKEVALWYKFVYKNRNRIIHGDFNPKEEECFDLFSMAYNFIAFLQERIYKNKRKKKFLYEEYFSLPIISLFASEINPDKLIKNFEKEGYNLFSGDNNFKL